jgi:ssDNA-binding Zn-finger/Zn-ribbon topoisomerase 1
LTDKKFKGHLDRLGENVDVLDEAIENARVMSKAEKGADSRTALQWAKTLRDLVELRNTTLANIKVHLLGRDETGAITEPQDFWDSNQQVMYEREFKRQLAPWTLEDLKLQCEDCKVESEDVEYHNFPRLEDKHWREVVPKETANLCPQCADKRAAARSAKYEKSKAEESGNHQGTETASPKIDLSQLLRELKGSN